MQLLYAIDHDKGRAILLNSNVVAITANPRLSLEERISIRLLIRSSHTVQMFTNILLLDFHRLHTIEDFLVTVFVPELDYLANCIEIKCTTHSTSSLDAGGSYGDPKNQHSNDWFLEIYDPASTVRFWPLYAFNNIDGLVANSIH